MAKKASEKSEKSEKPAETPSPAVSAAPQTPPPSEKKNVMSDTPTPESSAIVPAASAALSSPREEALRQKKEWANKLTHKRADILTMDDRPTPDQLMNIVLALPDELQMKMLEVVKKANPKKQGAHTARSGFSPTQVRLYQGTGNDPVRPRNTLPGQFYTAGSQVLGESFKGAVIHFYEGRIMWPPRDQSGGAGGGGGTAPLCYSLDRSVGSKYGPCNQCPNSSKPYNQGGCAREVVIYFIDEDMTGIYEMRFSKSSQGSGESLIKVLTKSENIWDRWVTFESVERSEGQKRWFVQKAGAVNDPKKPENNHTPKALHELFSNLSKMIDWDVYIPTLADTYDRARTSSEASGGGAGAPADTFDEKKLLGNAATDDNPDYSDTPNV